MSHDHDHDCGHDHDHDCGHDHDHDCGHDHVEIAFELIEGALAQRGLNADEVNDALVAAIDELERANERGESPGRIEDLPLLVRGATYRCGEIFEISISGEPDEESDEDEA